MKQHIYSLSLFVALATVPSVAFGQFDRLKKMKEKVAEKVDKPAGKAPEKKSEPAAKEEEPAKAEEKSAPAPAPKKEESAPAPSGPPPAEYLPNGDVKVLYGAGNDDREREYISASPASSSIFNFRQAMIMLIDDLKADQTYKLDGATEEMVKYFKEVKDKDPKYDTKKYEATVQRYVKANDDRNKAAKEKQESGDKDAMDATNGVIARRIKEISPGKYYYSALISQNKKNAYYVNSTSPDYKYIVNAVMYNGEGSRRVKYYEFSKTDARSAHSLTDEHISSYGAKGVLVEDDANKKTEECFCSMYSVQVGFEGIVAEKDGSITVFHAPIKDSKKQYDFDLDKIDVDVLNKDLNAAKAVNLEEKKKEAIAYINKTLKKKDAADAGDKTKRIAEKRRTPIGMAAAIPVATMKDELGKMLASKPVYGTNMQRNSAECSYTVTTAYVIDRDWVIDRNELGVILGRKIATEAVEKGSNGKCYLRRYCFYEQNQGGDKYGAPFIEYEIFWSNTTDDGEAICDNIK